MKGASVERILFAGIDVDDKFYHFSLIDRGGVPLVVGARCKRDPALLVKKIREKANGREVLCGYEATYVGYSLHRQLSAIGMKCKVIAPTSIGRAPGQTVKNDRIDSMRLSIGMKNDEFSYVHVPTVDEEADRQLVRSRQFIVGQISDLKRLIVSQCRLAGLDYKHETEAKSYWTREHRDWLDKKITTLAKSTHIMLVTLISVLENLQNQRDSLTNEIYAMAEQPTYKKKVDALTCFKGLETTSAMQIITEIVDIKRFSHPKKLVSFMGLDISEYSSGGKQLQFGISKMGNRRLRTVLVEANQSFGGSPTPSKRKCRRRAEKPKEMLEIADRCQERLFKKGHRLLAREKNRNKVKVACAREMVGFLWEALNLAA